MLGYFYLLAVRALAQVGANVRDFLPALMGAPALEAAKSRRDETELLALTGTAEPAAGNREPQAPRPAQRRPQWGGVGREPATNKPSFSLGGNAAGVPMDGWTPGHLGLDASEHHVRMGHHKRREVELSDHMAKHGARARLSRFGKLFAASGSDHPAEDESPGYQAVVSRMHAHSNMAQAHEDAQARAIANPGTNLFNEADPAGYGEEANGHYGDSKMHMEASHGPAVSKSLSDAAFLPALRGVPALEAAKSPDDHKESVDKLFHSPESPYRRIADRAHAATATANRMSGEGGHGAGALSAAHEIAGHLHSLSLNAIRHTARAGGEQDRPPAPLPSSPPHAWTKKDRHDAVVGARDGLTRIHNELGEHHETHADNKSNDTWLNPHLPRTSLTPEQSKEAFHAHMAAAIDEDPKPRVAGGPTWEDVVGHPVSHRVAQARYSLAEEHATDLGEHPSLSDEHRRHWAIMAQAAGVGSQKSNRAAETEMARRLIVPDDPEPGALHEPAFMDNPPESSGRKLAASFHGLIPEKGGRKLSPGFHNLELEAHRSLSDAAFLPALRRAS